MDAIYLDDERVKEITIGIKHFCEKYSMNTRKEQAEVITSLGVAFITCMRAHDLQPVQAMQLFFSMMEHFYDGVEVNLHGINMEDEHDKLH